MTEPPRSSPARPACPRIDIVIPHVDGSTPGFEDLCRAHTGEFVPCQLRALGELRFVMRSIEKHAPWASIVLVVQSQGHVPAWVNRQTVRIVLHDDFIPSDLLPTFHFATIAAHLHLIPELSEQYVYWEDDVLIASDLRQSDLFATDGLLGLDWATTPIPYGLGRFLGAYQLNLEETRRSLGRLSGREASAFVYPHAPLPATCSSWTAFFTAAIREPSFRSTVTRKSRGNERLLPTVDPLVLYANWVDDALRGRTTLARYGRAAKTLATRLLSGGLRSAKYAVVNNERCMRRNMERLRHAVRRTTRSRDVVFLNVNDDAYDAWCRPGETPDGSTLNPSSERLLIDTLAELFPEQSRHEVV